jgi:hypothetical protein
MPDREVMDLTLLGREIAVIQGKERGQSPILDASGAPYRAVALEMAQRGDSPVAQLLRMGVKIDEGGNVSVPAEALAALRANRIRSATVTQVPNTPRNMFREVGGMAVSKGHSRWETMSLEGLRRMRDRSPLLNSIHQARHFQVRHMSRKWSGKKGTVGLRVCHVDHTERDAIPPEGFDRYIDTFEHILRAPAPSYNVRTTSDLLVPLWEDLATINRPAVEKLRSAVDPNRIVGFRPVDGGILWPTLAWVEKWQRDNPSWAPLYARRNYSDSEILELLAEAMGHDLRYVDYVLVRDGVVERTYSARDIVIFPMVNRTDITYAGYPPSHAEAAAEAVMAFLTTWEFNAGQFTRGMMADTLIALMGDVWTESVDSFIDEFREASMGVRNAHTPMFLELPSEGTIQQIDLKKTANEMGFETWASLVVAFACADYRIDPTTINAKPWQGGNGAHLGGENREKEIALAKEEGLQGDLGFILESGIDILAMDCHPDLRVVAEYGDYDPKKEVEVYEVQLRTYRTRNEIRVEDGLDPVGFWVATRKEYIALTPEEQQRYDENPWNMPTDQGYAGQINQARMARQQQQQPGAPGAQPPADGFGQPDDGFGNPDDLAGHEHQANQLQQQQQMAAMAQPGGKPSAMTGASNGAPPPPPYGTPQADMMKARRGRVTFYVADIPR